MTMTRIARFASLLGLLVAPLGAQEPPAQPPALDSAAAELVFDREVFEYPNYERRNPFRPLVGADESGPRFDQVRLRGIIWSADPARSVALFQGGATGPDAVAGTRRLRRGESWGNMRVVEIQQGRVVVDVNEFGLTERRVLELTRQRAGGR
jgi:hypothetical protein